MRVFVSLVFLCATFFAAPVFAEQEQLAISLTIHTLVKWTPKNLKERESRVSLPGPFVQCGDYLYMGVSPSGAKRWFGFGVANRDGTLRSVVPPVPGLRMRVWLSPDGMMPSARLYRDISTPTSSHYSGYIIFLPPKEYAQAMTCLVVKKNDSSDTPKKAVTM